MRSSCTTPPPARPHAQDRAFRGGIDDVGIGTLFGLHDYRYECLAMLMHANHLEAEYGAGGWRGGGGLGL